MKYDNMLPLTFIHIPKTGGTSVREVFNKWFGPENIIHCYDKTKILTLQEKYKNKNDIVLYGHFNKAAPCVKDAKQLMTIMRDPFKCAVSEYFHRKRTGRLQETRNTLVKQLTNKFNTLADRTSLNITKENYKKIIDTKFLAIGTCEKMHYTLNTFAKVLNKPYIKEEDIPLLNIAPSYDDEVNSVTDEHIHIFNKNNELEILIYNYVLNK
jgi:hypothetical protein